MKVRFSGHVEEDLDRISDWIAQDMRIAVVRSYVILFRIRKPIAGEFVQIERIVHGGRDLPRL